MTKTQQNAISGKSHDLARPFSNGEIALIHAAERLFAERGIQGASLRQINLEAGSRNLSAAHYHFGSREGLVEAILKHREIPIDHRRQELLSRAGHDEAPRDVRFYLEAYIRPLAEALIPRPEGNYYLRFLAQFRHWEQDHTLMRAMLPAAYQMGEALVETLDYLPPAIVVERVKHLRGMAIVALADAEAEICIGKRDPVTIPSLGENLTDMLSAGLTAPVSASSKKLMLGSTSGQDQSRRHIACALPTKNTAC